MRGGGAHPLISFWNSTGLDAFVGLNSLAEDLRVVHATPGFDAVLQDLKNGTRYRAANHMLHCAALFARTEGQTLEEFFPQDALTRPDFGITVASRRYAVEVKQLFPSVPQSEFEAFATPFAKSLIDAMATESTLLPVVSVVLHDHRDRPTVADVVPHVHRAFETFDGRPLLIRAGRFNIVVEAPHPSPLGFRNFSCCLVMSPRDVNENFRVLSRAKEASGQLKPLAAEGRTGILCLGVTEFQHHETLSELFKSRFLNGQLSGISKVLLLRSASTGQPNATIVDALATIVNSRHNDGEVGELRLSSAGILAPLAQVFAASHEVVAYRVADARATVGDPTGNLRMPIPTHQFLPATFLQR